MKLSSGVPVLICIFYTYNIVYENALHCTALFSRNYSLLTYTVNILAYLVHTQRVHTIIESTTHFDSSAGQQI